MKGRMKMKKVILIGVPHHCNLGDHAIAIAEKKFIERYFHEYKYQEIAEENVHKCLNKFKNNIDKEDIIMLHGGGNLGNQYLFTELGRRKVVETFPENIIISFPQTIFFDDTEEGKKEIEISKKIYGSHKKMIFMAREEKSYEIMKEIFNKNKIFLTPDIVTILDVSNIEKKERKGALMILRNDMESKIDNEVHKKIEQILTKNYNKVHHTDTAKGDGILGHRRKEELQNMFEKYVSSEIVVTDRLHGMIFAAITGTPCIAFDNYNHKIKFTYKWLEKFEYIRYIEDYNDLFSIENTIQELKQIKNRRYDNKFAIDIFDEVMRNLIEEMEI